jgi:acyl-CoA synthetase
VAGASSDAHANTFREIVDQAAAAAYRAAGWWGDTTLAGLVTEHAAGRPDGIAYAADDGDLTWRTLDECSDRIAGALIATGTQPGVRVGVLLPDGASVHAVYLACEKAGLTIVGIGARAGRREIGHLLGRTGASVLVTTAEFRGEPTVALFAALAAEATSLRHHVVIPTFERTLDAPIMIDGVACDAAPITAATRADRAMGPDDLFLVNSTSGTTGLPKVVMHTQNRWRHFHQVAVRHGDLRHDDVFLSAIPAPFGFGIWTAHSSPIRLGAPCVVPSHFSAEGTAALIERHRVTVLCCVSTQFVMMCNSDALDRFDLSSLRVMFTGGEAVPYSRAEEFERRTGSRILQFYGSNETGLLSGTTLADSMERRLATAGRVVAEMRVRLFDGDVDVTASGYGQPACRGPATSVGYLDDPAGNAELFTVDGWMRMGDLCRIDADGYLTVVGRTSDVIIRGGKNISAAEVEAEVASHPAVELVGAVPMRDPLFGERVCVYVQLRPGHALDLDALVQHLLGRGVGKELLPERLIVVDEMPFSSGAKIAKGELRADLDARLRTEAS